MLAHEAIKIEPNNSISIRNTRNYTFNIPRGVIEQWRAANRSDPHAVNKMLSNIRNCTAIPSDYVVHSEVEQREHAHNGSKTQYAIITYRVRKQP